MTIRKPKKMGITPFGLNDVEIDVIYAALCHYEKKHQIVITSGEDVQYKHTLTDLIQRFK